MGMVENIYLDKHIVRGVTLAFGKTIYVNSFL